MKKAIRKIACNVFLLVMIFSTNAFFIQIASASEAPESVLIEKISKDYTKKFCNSIGFGLSKESAMKFSYSENKQIFKKRKGIKNIDKDLLAHKIAYSVIDNCGYQIDLYGDKSIEEFASFYLLLDENDS
tara:strand:- start:426 stop:815 length:390 start_codon:yes stop_codon:yes gene_type:complete